MQRGQATVEYAGICLLVACLLLGASTIVRAQLRSNASGDSASLELAARYAPRFLSERGDGEHPVDFGRCRQPACALGGRPVLYVHAVRTHWYRYFEYWEYLPRYTTLYPIEPANPTKREEPLQERMVSGEASALIRCEDLPSVSRPTM